MSNAPPRTAETLEPVALGPGSTVLVLDPEASAREPVCRFLARHGYDALQASTLGEASAAFEKRPVAAIVLDVSPPHQDRTLTLLDDLRRLPQMSGTPALVMTARILGEREQEAIARQRGYLFYKPDGLSALIGFLKQINQRA